MSNPAKAENHGPGNDAGRVRRTSVFPFRSLLRKAADEEGAGLVEFALSATVFFAILFGIMGFSILAYSYLFVSNAAREATRYAIVRGANFSVDCTAAGPANCKAQPSDIREFVDSLAIPGISVNDLNVSTNWLTPTGASCGSDDSCKVPGNQVQVQVSYTYNLDMPFVPQQTFDISSSSQMVIAQ